MGQVTEKTSGDLTILIFTQTLIRNHRLKLVGKSLKREIIKKTNMI